jgi:hypothetical protein
MGLMFGWRKQVVVNPDRLRRIEAAGYRVADDGTVVCSTCGGWCGQCGDDHSAESVEEFERQQSSRNSKAAN